MKVQLLVTAIGLLAQGFFSARILVQWAMSEKARRVLSPSLFWIFSIAGSYLLCLYGWLRDDFAIVFGQLVSYYIYLWNLQTKDVWLYIPKIVRWTLVATPIVLLGVVGEYADEYIGRFLHNSDVPLGLLLFGSAGQLVFTMRFVCQWYCSRKAGESRLPLVFWLLSLVGSVSIIAYGVMRCDVVLILGQSFGIVAYVRNIMLLAKTDVLPHGRTLAAGKR